MSDSYALFRAKAPGIMKLLMKDFDLDAKSAAAIVGNSGAECNGFRTFQEIRPVVKGSRGGYGWFQWTGPRRRAFEAYCARNKLDPKSDKANYGWLFCELKGAEKRAIPKVKAAKTLTEKVVAFEQAFLRAGVKHYPARRKYAEVAMEAYGNGDLVEVLEVGPIPTARRSLISLIISLFRKAS
jgi:hypothetical protein